MNRKLTGGLLSAAYHNACNMGASHMAVVTAERYCDWDFQTGVFEKSVLLFLEQKPLSLDDFKKAVGSQGDLVGVYEITESLKTEFFDDERPAERVLEKSLVWPEPEALDFAGDRL